MPSTITTTINKLSATPYAWTDQEDVAVLQGVRGFVMDAFKVGPEITDQEAIDLFNEFLGAKANIYLKNWYQNKRQAELVTQAEESNPFKTINEAPTRARLDREKIEQLNSGLTRIT